MPDYLFLMESRLHPAQWKAIVQVQQAAEALGMNVYLAGGAVRDLIGGFPIEDLEFVVEGKALKVVQELVRAKARVSWRNEALQAAHLEFPAGVVAAVSMARAGIGPNSSRPPAGPATILDDLRRRDFSINAIGISLNPHSRGLLLDPTNGVADMEKKELRALQPNGFLLEPIRLLRAVHLRARLHFTLEPKTAAQFQNAKESKVWEKIPGEDLEQEFRQIARERETAEILKALEREKLLTVLHPRLQGSRVNWQGMARAAKAAQMLAAAGLPVRSFPLFLHLLTAKLSPADRAQVASRLRLKPPDSTVFRKLPDQARRLTKELGGKAAATPTKLYQLLSAAPPELILLVEVEFQHTKIQGRLRNYLRKYLPLRSKLPEQELVQLGVAAGSVRYEKIREQYFYALLEGKAHTRTEQAKLLKKLAQPGK
jgi:tRNA nucleotidyltransferase/poly(A) polymerase